VSVLFDLDPEPAAAPPARRWAPRPMPSGAQLLGEALRERSSVPSEVVRSVRAGLRAPMRLASGMRESLGGISAMARAGFDLAPHSPYNDDIGPHRRFTWARTWLGDVKAIKNELGGTVNDVVLAMVSGALARHLKRRGEDISELELKAMVPVSVRSAEQRGALGNQVAAIWAPLPVWCEDPVERLHLISAAMQGLKEGKQAVGAQVLTELSGFAPATILNQASRLMARQRFFNLVVTNVPGPQVPLYLMGREMIDLFPMVPLAAKQALGIALMSYNGRLNFGLTGDYDLMPDLDDLAGDLHAALAELADAAGTSVTTPPQVVPAPVTEQESKADAGAPAE
jgi:diacylglycerol O-acyltransferase / wax synthase